MVIALIIGLAVINLGIILVSRRKDKYQQIGRVFFYPRPRYGADPRKWFSSSVYGDWFLGERVNDAIMAGKERYAHNRIRRHRRPRRHSH
jgi:hypothetical protein